MKCFLPSDDLEAEAFIEFAGSFIMRLRANKDV